MLKTLFEASVAIILIGCSVYSVDQIDQAINSHRAIAGEVRKDSIYYYSCPPSQDPALTKYLKPFKPGE